jgi:hypothetical protein
MGLAPALFWDIDLEDVSDFEFDLPCEFKNCPETATRMMKGCSDKRPFAVCPDHYNGVRDRFYKNYGAQCSGCERPWLHFETHYDYMSL